MKGGVSYIKDLESTSMRRFDSAVFEINPIANGFFETISNSLSREDTALFWNL